MGGVAVIAAVAAKSRALELVSQVLTLFTTPAIHLWISRIRRPDR